MKKFDWKIVAIIIFCVVFIIFSFYKLNKYIEEKKDNMDPNNRIEKVEKEEITNNPLFTTIVLSGILTGEIICACVCLI